MPLQWSVHNRVAPDPKTLMPSVTSAVIHEKPTPILEPNNLYTGMRQKATSVPSGLYYSNPAKFTHDLQKCRKLINRCTHQHPIPKLTRTQIADAYHLYANALSRPEQVIGNNDIIWASTDLISNFGATSGFSSYAYQQRRAEILSSDQTSHHARKTITQVSPSDGLILFGDHWTILANDALIVSKAHAISKHIEDDNHVNHGMIYFAAHNTFISDPMLDVWCDKRQSLRVTGREIIGLYHFGFRPYIRRNAQGTLFVQFILESEHNINKARNANLVSYTQLMLDPKWNNRAYVEHFFRTDITRVQTCW